MTKLRGWRMRAATQPVKLENRFGEFLLEAHELDHPSLGYVTTIVLTKGDCTHDALVRINSACLTGEVFGCRRCECAWQLQQAMRRISREGRGVIVYCPGDEGRGVGLFHKIRSFHVMDTTNCGSAEAFVQMGLRSDLRNYDPACLSLRHIGVRSVRLLTSNPHKLAAVEAAGIEVGQRVDLDRTTPLEI